ncbi:multiple epidermal growth factor-like domains protein 10 [Magallana gigas]|uniref:multiple epidermal growth factor-like domains protein 10 n=1 Tax=Magallana gigas TaxID=29159 RepID=UPI0033410873
MYGFKFMHRRNVLFFYIWIVSDANYPKNSNIKELREECIYGYFKDGNACRACPAGYTGLNCSQKCTMPTYGVLCGGICSCSSCHHEVGCISTPEFTGNDIKDLKGTEQETTLVSNPCLFNQYKYGNDCKDCPAGYFGNGCTEKCVLPSFGRACSDTCNCSFCHHVFGCILSSEFKECPAGYFRHNCSDKCPWPTYGVWCNRTCPCVICDHILGCVTTTEAPGEVSESQNEKEIVSAVKGISLSLIILLVGGTITLVLIVLIFYTIWKHQSLVSTNHNGVDTRTIHEIEPVYHEFNEGFF